MLLSFVNALFKMEHNVNDVRRLRQNRTIAIRCTKRKHTHREWQDEYHLELNSRTTQRTDKKACMTKSLMLQQKQHELKIYVNLNRFFFYRQ